jgi:hypothetical protein
MPDHNLSALYDSDQHCNTGWQPDADTTEQPAVTVISGKVVWDEITYIESSLYHYTQVIVCTPDNMAVLDENKRYRVVIVEIEDTTE